MMTESASNVWANLSLPQAHVTNPTSRVVVLCEVHAYMHESLPDIIWLQFPPLAGAGRRPEHRHYFCAR